MIYEHSKRDGNARDESEMEASDYQTSNSLSKMESKNLRAGFGTVEVLKGINLQMREKSITAIMGPSGCGKTTFIRCLNRLHETNAWSYGRRRGKVGRSEHLLA